MRSITLNALKGRFQPEVAHKSNMDITSRMGAIVYIRSTSPSRRNCKIYGNDATARM